MTEKPGIYLCCHSVVQCCFMAELQAVSGLLRRNVGRRLQVAQGGYRQENQEADAYMPGSVTARYFLRARVQDRQQGDSGTKIQLTNPSAAALAIPGAVNQCLRTGSNLSRAPLTEPRTPLSLSLLP